MTFEPSLAEETGDIYELLMGWDPHYGDRCSELVVIGARTLAAEKRAQRHANDALLAELADSIRAGGPALGDPVAADEVRRTGWARPA